MRYDVRMDAAKEGKGRVTFILMREDVGGVILRL
jgi:hypothetical protein